MSYIRRRPKSTVLANYPSRRSYIEAWIDDDELESEDDGQNKNLTMKDKDEMLQELKKENFDLKLRLYMTQKTSETAEGKVGEYEQQLAALLNSMEDQQRLSDQQTNELNESKQREKELLHDKKKLENVCTQQDEQIHNLSLNLSKISKSMHNVHSTPNHSTPLRNVKSEYFPNDDDDNDDVHIRDDGEDHEHGIRPFSNQVNISHVSPMPREAVSASSYHEDTSHLVDNDRGVHQSFSEGTKYSVNQPTTKNYNYNTPTMEGRNNRNEGFDNVGVVRPNNTRTVVDVAIPEPIREKDKPKKKKKGLMKVFKLCTGKSGQPVSRKESMYTKREPAHVTMTTYSNDAV